MSDVYVISNGQLMHAATRKRHKYIAKVRTKNGKYRYFYDQDKYEAYLKSKNKKRSKSSIFDRLGDFSNWIKSLSFKKTIKETGDAIEKGKKIVQKLFTNMGDYAERIDKKTSGDKKFKYVKRIRLSNGKYRYFYSNEEYDRYVARLNYQNNEPNFMKKTPKISEDKSFTNDEDMKEVNEEYSSYDDGRSRNCVYCSAAYELRCRGYDVQAKEYTNPLSYRGSNFHMKGFYENPKMITIDSKGNEHKSVLNNTTLYKKHEYADGVVNDAILKHSGKDTRGEIRVTWKSGGGHSMVYEVRGNSVIIRDCQTNKTYTPDEIGRSANQVTITRTDNLKLKKGILKTVEDN